MNPTKQKEKEKIAPIEIKQKSSGPPPRPRGSITEKMCEKCPFRPDGSGYAVDHPDIVKIKWNVEVGLPFYCHETVIFDKRTSFKNGNPNPTFQEHFELCRGGHEHRMKKWKERNAKKS